jgi:hypothetical protein
MVQMFPGLVERLALPIMTEFKDYLLFMAEQVPQDELENRLDLKQDNQFLQSPDAEISISCAIKYLHEYEIEFENIMQQVGQKILDNFSNYTPKGDKLEIHAERYGSEVLKIFAFFMYQVNNENSKRGTAGGNVKYFKDSVKVSFFDDSLTEEGYSNLVNLVENDPKLKKVYTGFIGEVGKEILEYFRHSSRSTLNLTGLIESVAEREQQMAWLGSSLRPSVIYTSSTNPHIYVKEIGAYSSSWIMTSIKTLNQFVEPDGNIQDLAQKLYTTYAENLWCNDWI